MTSFAAFCAAYALNTLISSLSLFRGLDYALWSLHSVTVCFIVKTHLRTSWGE